MDAAVALVQAYLHVNGYFTVTEYPVLEGLKNVRTVTDLDILAYRLAGASAPVADGLHGEVGSAGVAVRDPGASDRSHRASWVTRVGPVRPGGTPPVAPNDPAGRRVRTSTLEGAASASWWSGPDGALGAPATGPDMIVGEVKEGRARLNPAMRDPRVLAVALARFGCCDSADAPALTRRLLSTGHVRTPVGHTIRIVAFGDTPNRFEARRGSAGGDDVPVARSPGGAPGAATTVSMRHVVDFLQEHLTQHWQQARHAQFNDPALGVLAMLQKWADHPAGGHRAAPARRDGQS